MTQPAADKPKIIIDEDWKSKVQAEKEELARQEAVPSAPRAAQDAAGDPSVAGLSEREQAEGEHPDRGQLPPASLSVLFTSLATQALAALGQFADPASEKVEVYPDEAKHCIDLLDVLNQKTAGNRTPQESALLDNILHELRLAFVSVQRHLAGRPS